MALDNQVRNCGSCRTLRAYRGTPATTRFASEVKTAYAGIWSIGNVSRFRISQRSDQRGISIDLALTKIGYTPLPRARMLIDEFAVNSSITDL